MRSPKSTSAPAMSELDISVTNHTTTLDQLSSVTSWKLMPRAPSTEAAEVGLEEDTASAAMEPTMSSKSHANSVVYVGRLRTTPSASGWPSAGSRRSHRHTPPSSIPAMTQKGWLGLQQQHVGVPSDDNTCVGVSGLVRSHTATQPLPASPCSCSAAGPCTAGVYAAARSCTRASQEKELHCARRPLSSASAARVMACDDIGLLAAGGALEKMVVSFLVRSLSRDSTIGP
mmetsp:Transcript_26298/g.49957  ORF Transcript_26298/g.49957 Transcript_26298/m.49957 type:complete len:230 (-) Transcript_26298:977-1666(-)